MEVPNIKIKEKFEGVYEKEADALFRYCVLRVSNRNQAIDIIQDVFLELWRAYQKGEEIKNDRAYLFTMLRNRIIDWYRKKKSSSLDAMMENPRENINFEPIDEKAHLEIYSSAETRRIMEAIETLPGDYRDAVYLKVAEDLSPPEIASILNSNTNIISIRITRGIQKLKKKLNIEEFL